MEVKVSQSCRVCGNPTELFEQGIHAGCYTVEEANSVSQLKTSETVCRLCGEPTMPFERGFHNDCISRENMFADMQPVL